METIKSDNKKSRKYLVLTLVLCILFAFSAVQCFAQVSSKKSTKKTDSADDVNLQVIEELYYYIQQNYVDEVDPQVLYEGALKGMLDSLGDPYTCYMDQADWRSITDTTSGSFGGVGLSISKAAVSTPDKPAYVEVVSPLDDSPGAKAGIQPGDLIISIEGVDTSTISMEDVLGMLRGTIGESVNVTIKRGKNMTFDRTLVRALIENPTVKYGMIGKTGYIRVSEFGANTSDRFQEALDSFDAAGYDSLIIDLRNNGGGLLNTAISLADKFIDQGPIVSTKSRIAYENSVYYAKKRNTVVRDMPVIVLINGGSASASEILSGALKDSKKAYLVGERTYGKGSVQYPRPLLNNDGFKLTIARYYTPSDVNIDKVGIPADREVLYPDFSDEEADAFVALQDSTVIQDYVEAHPSMTEQDIAAFAVNLKKTYNLELRVLRKLIRNEVDRTKPSRLYDLDYDLQLNAALDILKNENFADLMSTSKTLKEIQDADAAAGNSGSGNAD